MFGLSWQNSLILVVTCCCCIFPVVTMLLLVRFRAVAILIPVVGIVFELITNTGSRFFGRKRDNSSEYVSSSSPQDSKESLAQIRAQTDSSFGAQVAPGGQYAAGGQFGAQSAQQPPGNDPFRPDPSAFQPNNAAYNPNAPNQAFQAQGGGPPQQPPQGYPPQNPQQPQNPQAMYPVRPGGQYGYRIEPGAPGPQYSAQRGGPPPQQGGQRPSQQGYPPQQPGQRPPQQGYPPQQPGQPPNPAQQGGSFPNPNISLGTGPGQPPAGMPGFSNDDYYGDAGIPGLRNNPQPPRRDNRGSEWREGEIFGGMLDDDGDGHPDF